MSVKRKISVRKIIQALLTIVLAVVCITAVISANQLHSNRKLNNVDIQIKNAQHGFVTQAEVKAMLLRDGEIKEHTTKLSKLNVRQMERVVISNPWVQDAQVYIDNKQNLHALVTQRVPVVRIFEKNGNSYYIDKNLEALPLSTKYNYYTTVVTNVPVLKQGDSADHALKERIMALVSFIRRDTFWNAQVSQVVVRDDLNFEIVPVLGEQQIVIGDTTDMKEKFDNLFAFYNKVLNEVGWDKYELLDLSYKGQLVASPAINWKLPVDKVINRINWVNSILGEDPEPLTASNVIVAKPARPVEVKAEAPPVIVKKKIDAPVAAKAEKKTEIKPVAAPASKPKSVKPEPVKKTVPQAKPKQVVKKEVLKAIKKEAKKEIIQEPKQPVAEEQKEDKKPKYIYNGGGN